MVIAHTVKGKGVGFMEREPGWHLGYLDPADEQRVLAELRGGRMTGRRRSAVAPGSSETLIDQAPVLRTLADTLADLVDEGAPVVVCTADLKHSNGLVRFERRHPERFFQFGISEQNMVSAAAGMAAPGLEPYVATFASFLALLCAEQIRTDVAYTGLPVRLIGHHAGISLGLLRDVAPRHRGPGGDARRWPA